MLSDAFKDALSHEVIGQPQAVNSIVRGVTRLMSGMTPRERSWCAYLFVGPPGTGRSHVVRSLARILHGDETAVLSLSCNPGVQTDPWLGFIQQLTPLFARRVSLEPVMHPNLVLIQDLECARKEFYPMLARLLETGQLTLPDGKLGRIDNSLIILTTGLCTREILDDSAGIGFSGAAEPEGDEGEHDSIITSCREEAERVFGLDLLSQLDNQVVFRKLGDEHLKRVGQRHFERITRWLRERGIECTMRPEAETFLMAQGRRQPLLGARDLILAHRREVEFPLADLLISGRLAPGSSVVVDHREGEGHLHFGVEEATDSGVDASPVGCVREIPVA